jgi:hypothetical protein
MPKRKRETKASVPDADTSDPGSEYLMQEAQHALDAVRATPKVKKLAPYIKLIGQDVYALTQDGWYVRATIRDVKWAYGRIDFLLEQGPKVAWVNRLKCYLPPGMVDTETEQLKRRVARGTASASEEQPAPSPESGT